jgi:hypothetical protein
LAGTWPIVCQLISTTSKPHPTVRPATSIVVSPEGQVDQPKSPARAPGKPRTTFYPTPRYHAHEYHDDTRVISSGAMGASILHFLGVSHVRERCFGNQRRGEAAGGKLAFTKRPVDSSRRPRATYDGRRWDTTARKISARNHADDGQWRS